MWGVAVLLMLLLMLWSRYELDGFLKRHEVWLDYSIEELVSWI